MLNGQFKGQNLFLPTAFDILSWERRSGSNQDQDGKKSGRMLSKMEINLSDFYSLMKGK